VKQAAPVRIAQRARERGFSPARVYREHFAQSPLRERLFLSSVGFFGGFGIARAITHAIKHNIGPFHNIEGKGGFHLHHLVFGITGLLGVGYLSMLGVGEREGRNTAATRGLAVGYGASSALTLDEFALWLNLKDVYWEQAGRISVDAVVIFASLLSVGIWGGPFLRDVAKELLKVFRPKKPA
jgi:hypothetical protein